GRGGGTARRRDRAVRQPGQPAGAARLQGLGLRLHRDGRGRKRRPPGSHVAPPGHRNPPRTAHAVPTNGELAVTRTPQAAAEEAATELRSRTGVDSYDVALVMG